MSLANVSNNSVFRRQLHRVLYSPFRFSSDRRPLISSGIDRCRSQMFYSIDKDIQQICVKKYSISSINSGSGLQKRFGSLTEKSHSEESNELSNVFENCHTSQDILRALEDADAKALNSRIICDIAKSLFELEKSERSLLTKRDMLNSVGMQKFCKIVRYKAKFMEAEDLLSFTKLFTLLAATSSHLTFQIVLKVFSKKVNTLQLSQIVYFQFLLSKLKEDAKSPLTEALEVALPIVFESQLKIQVDVTNIQTLCDYLHYSSKCNLSDQVVEVIVTALMRHDSKNITPKQALSIIWSLCDMEHNYPYQEDLIKSVLKKLTSYIEVFKPTEISTTLKKVKLKYMKNYKFFYQEDFIDAVCNMHLSKHSDPIDTMYLFKAISLMQHVNVVFIDRVADIVCTNGTPILKDNKRLFISLLKSFSNANYTPDNWAKVQTLIQDSDLTTETTFGDIDLATNMLTLGIFPEAIIRNLFSPENIPMLEEYIDRNNDPLSLIILGNAVNLLHKDYNGSRLPSSFFDRLKTVRNARRSDRGQSLKNALISAFGGNSYVLSDLFYNGLNADHGVVLRKGGYPVAINCENKSSADLLSVNSHAAPDSVIVLVKVFFKGAYANNTSRLRGIHAFELKLLESIGHPVIHIDGTGWAELSDFERIPYLMQKIKEKVEKFQWNRNSGDVIPS